MNISLSGKNAIVTGGGRGIGRAICEELSRLGANIVVNYASNEAEAEKTRLLCPGSVIVQADVAVETECERIFEACESAFGPVNILINNAGISRDNLLMRMSDNDFDRVMSVNLKGAFNCTKRAARSMIKARAGRIINISSVVALAGNVGQSSYVASKSGLLGLTKAAALEFAPRGITVNAIAPGFIETEMTEGLSDSVKEQMLSRIPLGHFGSPRDIAQVTAFLCSDGAGYITGQTINVNGGMLF